MIKIGEFSSLAKTTIKTLRFYDEIDLFKPAKVDNNGYRYYEIEQLGILQTILDLRNLNMPLEEIRKILSGENVSKILESRLKSLEKQLETDTQNIALVKNYMAKAKKGDFMNTYKAKEILLPNCIVYYRHGIIDSMNDMVPFILEAGAEAKQNNPDLKCLPIDYCYVCYSAKEYKEKNVELEYCEAVEKFGKESKNIKFKEMPEEKAISITHKGAYTELGKAYAFAVNYVKENDYTIANPIRERYIHGCWDCQDENDYVTEIQIPIK